MFGQQQVFFDQLTTVDTSAKAELGAERWESGKKYLYVQNASSDTTCVDKQAVDWAHASDFTVYPTTATGVRPAGIVQTAIPPQYYGWLQTGGFADATVYGSISAGVTLGVTGTGGFLNDSSTAGEYLVGGAAADSTADVVSVYMQL